MNRSHFGPFVAWLADRQKRGAVTRHERASSGWPRLASVAIASVLLGFLVTSRSVADDPSGESDVAAGAVAEAEPLARAAGVVRLRRGDLAVGRLVAHERAEELAWRNPEFQSPFVFPLRSIASAAFPAPAGGRPAPGGFGVELINGDQWFGSIVGIDDETLHLHSPTLGDLPIRRALLRRLFRWRDGQAMLYNGPGSVDAWETFDDEDAWQDVGGQLRTERSLATLYQDIGLPAQARIEVELSWEGKPNFVLSIGVDETETSAARAHRLEVWDSTLVLLRELEASADLAPLGSVADAEGHLRLTIDLDQADSRATVFSERGEVLADMAIGDGRDAPLPGIRLQNIEGNVQLDALRVVAAGESPVAVTGSDPSSFQLSGGEIVSGRWMAVEDDAWIVGDGQEEHRIDPDQVVAARFAQGAPEGTAAEGDEPAEGEADAPAQLRVMTHSGFRSTGQLERVDDGVVRLRAEGVGRPVTIDLADLRYLVVLNSQAGRPESGSRRVGRLEVSGTTLHGWLSDSETAGLSFQPLDAVAPASLRRNASGRLVYRDPDPEPTVEQRQQMQQRQQRQGIVGAFINAFTGSGANQGGAFSTGKVLHLRSGDIVPCEIVRIDDEGVVFESPIVGATRAPHDLIRAVQLSAAASQLTLDPTKRRRLLTVPRMRKQTPPTHLIVSTDGDFLRGRLQWLDEESLAVETRLDSITIDRRVVSQIIWFHLDELNDADRLQDGSSPGRDDPDTGLLVQSVQRNGVRLTFEPRQVGGGELVGDSPSLGVCLVDVGSVDQLLFGRQIEAAAEGSAYHPWRLAHAPEPKDVQQEGAEGGPAERGAGTASPLVGTEAPDFQLELLDGGSFRLSEQRGKVVVLDFWATWCGPCITAMPQVDEAVAAFPEDEVTLVAVNLQEPAARIRSTLERLQLRPTVAMDIDGVVAARYQANAIPQTVVVDREGQISRLFVGGGAQLGEHLRQAIDEATRDAAAAP